MSRPNACHDGSFPAKFVNYIFDRKYSIEFDKQCIGFGVNYDYDDDKEYIHHHEFKIVFLFWIIYYRW